MIPDDRVDRLLFAALAAVLFPAILATALFAIGGVLMGARFVYDVAANGGRPPEYVAENAH